MTVFSVLCSQLVGCALCGSISILVKASDLIIAVTCRVPTKDIHAAFDARNNRRKHIGQSESIEKLPR